MTGSVLVIGGTSPLGQSIRDKFLAAHAHVYWTSRWTSQSRQPDEYRLDLSDTKTPDDLLGLRPGTVILNAALTTQSACIKEPELAKQVNVISPVRLAQEFSDRGSLVMFISSNAVFDGNTQLAPATLQPSPLSLYGDHKVEAENALLKIDGAVSVLRFSKLSHSLVPLVSNWARDLSSGKVIQPFCDAYISPVTTSLAAVAVRKVVEARLTGISQLSASRDISYEDLARILARERGYSLSLIDATSSRERVETPFPDHTTLDSSRLSGVGIEAPAPNDCVGEILRQVDATSSNER